MYFIPLPDSHGSGTQTMTNPIAKVKKILFIDILPEVLKELRQFVSEAAAAVAPVLSVGTDAALATSVWATGVSGYETPVAYHRQSIATVAFKHDVPRGDYICYSKPETSRNWLLIHRFLSQA